MSNSITIPVNPFTIWINGMITDGYLNTFVKRFLPNFDIIITSKYRNKEHNEEVGGVADSTHLYNTGRDFAITNKEGEILSSDKMKAVYDEFIKPNWDGYTEFEAAHDGHSAHIHADIGREITKYTSIVGLAAAGGVTIWGARKLLFKLKRKGA